MAMIKPRWYEALTNAGKTVVWVGSALLVGSVISVAAQTGSPNENTQQPLTEVKDTVKQPVTETSTSVETEVIPYTSSTVEDSNTTKGVTTVSVVGVNGVKTKTFKITKVNGAQTSKDLVSETVTKQPVNEVISVGTYVKPVVRQQSNCDPNYSGACVPIASDVDCASGSGNGPAYTSGPVYVIGNDIYGLDRDGDGIGCE